MQETERCIVVAQFVNKRHPIDIAMCNEGHTLAHELFKIPQTGNEEV